LRSISGCHEGRQFMLHEQTRIGRAPDNEVSLNDHLVSRYHVLISRKGIHFDLRDLGSKNGVRVNNQPTMERRLCVGDQIRVGRTVFVFEVPREQKAARYSDSLIHLDAYTDRQMQIFERADLACEADADWPTGDLVARLARLLQSENEDLPAMLEQLLAGMIAQFRADSGALLLRTSSGDATPLITAGGIASLRISREAARLVLKEGKALIMALLREQDGEIRGRSRRALMLPLMRREQVIGALQLQRAEGAEFTRDDLARAMALAGLATGAVRFVIQMDQFILSGNETPSDPFIGHSQAAERVRERIRLMAANDSTTLLTGETGTGKELVAKSIHQASARASMRFVAIDCSAIPANLLESELFGHEAGAFTGADRLKRGKVEMADGGTLFLDEIGELQIELQPKLLRFLEERLFYRVGGTKPISADVRIIAATNRDLEKEVEAGRFRQDLLYRLNVMPLQLPPLRTRLEDVRLLVEHFAPRLAARLGKPFLGLVDEAWVVLERYSWPGNVRELRHGLERALILSDDGILRPEHFQLQIPEEPPEPTTDGLRTGARDSTVVDGHDIRPQTLAEAEAEAIRRALRFAGGNRIQAAQHLDIHRNTLAKKITQYGIDLEKA